MTGTGHRPPAALPPAPGPADAAVVGPRRAPPLLVAGASASKGLYPTQAEFDKAAASMADNAAFIAMAGPARALNTLGGQVAWQASAFGAIVAGLMSMFLVGRHTRAEEESGRDELVRAGAVGRHAPLAAAALDRRSSPTSLLGALVAVEPDRLRPRGRPARSASGWRLRWPGWSSGPSRSSPPSSPTAPGRCTASPAPSSRRPTSCGPSATSATARCRGSRRSAGARRCTHSPASGGGPR